MSPIHRSPIGWTDFSGGDLNFILGCTSIAIGCINCYGVPIAKRGGWDFSEVRIFPEKLERLRTAKFEEKGVPFRRGPGSRPLAFVCDLSDLFHENVHDDFIKTALSIFAARDDVGWQILTKRPERAAEMKLQFPRNVWFGISVSTQRDLEKMGPYLFQVKAAIRFISHEPALEALNLTPAFVNVRFQQNIITGKKRTICSVCGREISIETKKYWSDGCCNPLNWFIVGAESGPSRRPFDIAWAREEQRQCAEAGVPFFFKQDSHFKPGQGIDALGEVIQEFPA